MYPIVLIALMLQPCWGLIGYDCGSRALNITTLSLLDVEPCKIPDTRIYIAKPHIQLLQINEFIETEIIQCKFEIRRTVYYCGWNSNNYAVENGEDEYIYEVSREACINLHITGIMKFGGRIISGVPVNRTTTYPMTFAGKLNDKGSCWGVDYTDAYGSWNNVIVQGTLKVTLTKLQARVDTDNNKIHLPSGTMCTLSRSDCIDTEGGYTFWDPVPRDHCKFQHFTILFSGIAQKLVDSDIKPPQTVYSLSSKEITFALSVTEKDNVCGYTIWKTEHPKLLIFETEPTKSFALGKYSVDNLDIFAYVNSKFVYVERHIRTQIKYLYRDMLMQRCNLERETLKNSLAIATQAPDQFAYNLMKGPGYMAVTAGEVVHIIKCVPVEVKVEQGEHCFAELQVTKQNETYFMTPRTHILKSKGTRVSCNALLPSFYYFNEEWYKILPKPTEARDPITIKPLTKATWTYKSPAHLATSGIYTETELKELRERVMFPVEQQALLNDIARELHGHPIADKEGTIMKLLNEDTLGKIVESTWNRIWKKFLTFGTASAGIIAIFAIIQIIKMIIDIIIRGYTLHQIYGWSIHVIGAIWSSIAHLLIALNQRKQNKSTQKEQEAAKELLEIKTSQPSSSKGKSVEEKGFFSVQ